MFHCSPKVNVHVPLFPKTTGRPSLFAHNNWDYIEVEIIFYSSYLSNITTMLNLHLFIPRPTCMYI